MQFQNQSSIRASKANLLNQKTKSFRENYSKSMNRVSTKSNIHTLASTVYSGKYNKQFHSKTTSTLNPQKPLERSNSSMALKGLDMRVSHIPNMSDINTSLLMQKRRLEDHIAFLKEQIAKETRMRNKGDTNWRLHRNHKESTNQSYQDLCRKSDKINENITQTKNDNTQLQRDVNKLRVQNQETNDQKANEAKRVEDLQNRVNLLKNNLMSEQKARTIVKGELISKQKVMESCSIKQKELESERAMLLLQINQFVHSNKL